MTTLLIAGSTGLVGQAVLTLALADPRVTRIVAPTRRPLAVPTTTRLDNPVVDFAALPTEAPWWAVDAVICTLGTTRRQAGSDEAFRTVDLDYVVAVARAARAHGAGTFALTSSVGANAASRFLYLRTKGEVEEAVAALGFASYTVVRPAGLIGERASVRRGEQIANRVTAAMSFLIPRRYRVVSAERVAKSLLTAALDATPGRHLIQSEAIPA